MIEMVYRGYSYTSMMVLGGLCFVCIGIINEVFPWSLGLLWQGLIGAGIVTLLEFLTGCILNLWLGLGVWDYSNMPFNVLGQVCLPFYFAWVILAFVAIVLDDTLRWKFFHEDMPHYTMFDLKWENEE